MLPLDSLRQQIIRAWLAHELLIDSDILFPSYLYNFSPPSRSSVTPFAAAGINITHFSNGDCDDLKDVLGVDFDCGGTNAAAVPSSFAAAWFAPSIRSMTRPS